MAKSLTETAKAILMKEGAIPSVSMTDSDPDRDTKAMNPNRATLRPNSRGAMGRFSNPGAMAPSAPDNQIQDLGPALVKQGDIPPSAKAASATGKDTSRSSQAGSGRSNGEQFGVDSEQKQQRKSKEIMEEDVEISEELESFIKEMLEQGLSEEEIAQAIEENFELVEAKHDDDDKDDSDDDEDDEDDDDHDDYHKKKMDEEQFDEAAKWRGVKKAQMKNPAYDPYDDNEYPAPKYISKGDKEIPYQQDLSKRGKSSLYKKGPKTGKVTPASSDLLKSMIKTSLGKHTAPKHLPEEEQIDEERKRTANVATAFLAGKAAKQKELQTDGKQVTYHGNVIAKHMGDEVHVTTAGYGHSPSTRGHINGILNRLGAPTLSQKKGQLMHGDNPVGSKDWIKVKKTQKIEEDRLDEKTLTSAETSKKEELVKKMKKGDWSERYGKRGKEVMYATATKMAKKLAQEHISIESIQEEIRNSLLEKAHWLKENGTQEQVVEFLNNLTMEQREILNLAEADLAPGTPINLGQRAKISRAMTAQGNLTGARPSAAPAPTPAAAQNSAAPYVQPNPVSGEKPTPGEGAGIPSWKDTSSIKPGPGPGEAPAAAPRPQPTPAQKYGAGDPDAGFKRGLYAAPSASETSPEANALRAKQANVDRQSAVYESKSDKSLEKFLKEDFNGKKS